jgi:hypothetical protein
LEAAGAGRGVGERMGGGERGKEKNNTTLACGQRPPTPRPPTLPPPLCSAK